MSEMIERVARAMRDEAALLSDHRGYFTYLARAAIEAMREPTEGMVEAGKREAEDIASEYSDAGMLMVDVHRPWQAMIAAALADREGTEP